MAFFIAKKDEIHSFGFEKKLVNNFDLFHNNLYPTTDDLSKIPDYADDSDDSGMEYYPHINDWLLERDTIKKGDQVVARVDISDIFSCDKTHGGFDRVKDVYTGLGVKYCEKHLKRKIDESGEETGFNTSHCGTLFAYGRVEGNKVVLLKSQGNNRVLMKLLATRGVDAEMLVQITFHDPEADEIDMMRIEANNHYTDAEMRRGQNENDKFRAGFAAGDYKSKNAERFLRKAGFEFKGFFKDMGETKIGETKVDDLPKLKALTGLTSGPGNGWFRQYGEDNLLKTGRRVKKIMKLTGEKEITSSAFASLTVFTKALEEYGLRSETKALFDEEGMDKFVEKFFEMQNRPSQDSYFEETVSEKRLPIFGLRELNQTAFMKNYAFNAIKTFWPFVRRFYCNYYDKQQSFGADSAAGKYLLSEIGNDEWLTRQAKKILDGDQV